MRYFSFLSGTLLFGWAAGCALISGCGSVGSMDADATSSSSSGAGGSGGATSSSSSGAGGSGGATSSSSSGAGGSGGATSSSSSGAGGNAGCLPSTPAPVDAALPGESSECQALGIVACRLQFSGAYGQNVYDCVDANGANLLHVPVSDVATIPCSQAQLDAWVDAYETPCWRLLAWTDMPPSAITLLVDPGHMPQQVCSNVDGTSFRWGVRSGPACAEYVYRIQKTTGGGNFHGTYWSLAIAPASTNSLRTGYPFLACPSYEATKYHRWHVGVTQDAQSLVIHSDNVAPGGLGWSGSWQDVLDELVAQFTTCDAFYYW